MCGIAGIFDFSEGRLGDHLGRSLRHMLDRMQHRGPDDRGEVNLPVPGGHALHLGHQRLSIIDLTPGGHQPMANDAQTLWISTNSEIYNYRELRDELAAKYRFASHSDTEVLLKAYEEWGIDCLERLRGLFAFAIWDTNRNALFLARDRLGIKPLYYFHNENGFLFASELRALLASEIPDRALNPAGLFHYLSFGSLSSPETLIGSIRELPPGHWLSVSAGGKIETRRYWSPPRSEQPASGDAQQTVREKLETSLRYRLISDAPLGAFLSGGIDSSAVVAHAASQSPNPLQTLSVVYDEKEFDESRYSNLIAERYGTDHHALPLTQDDLLDALPHAVAAMDQPSVDGINTWLIARCAKQRGWKAALSGIGGDELFGGYEAFQLVPKFSRLHSFLAPLPSSIPRLMGTAIKRLSRTGSKASKLAHLLCGQTGGTHPYYYLIRALFCEDDLARLFTDPEALHREIARHRAASATAMGTIRALDERDQISYLELTHYLPNTLLRDADAMGMAHGLEIRVPLIDHELVESVFSLPAALKFKSATPKHLLAQSVQNGLPEEIVRREKMGFTLPFEHWMRGALKPEIESVLRTPVPPLTGFVSDAAVEKVWNDFMAKRIAWSRPWALYILKKWIGLNLSG